MILETSLFERRLPDNRYYSCGPPEGTRYGGTQYLHNRSQGLAFVTHNAAIRASSDAESASKCCEVPRTACAEIRMRPGARHTWLVGN